MPEAKIIAGAFFLLIIGFNLIADKFGYETFSQTDAPKLFTKILESPRSFRLSVVFIIIEHLSLIGLAVSMFIAFNETSLVLALIWLIARSAEGVLQIFFKREYAGLLGLAGQYRKSKGAPKKELGQAAQAILERKNTVFCLAQILFSIGTFAYSLFFVLYGVVPVWLGWFGLAAAVTYGVGSAVKLLKDSQDIWNVGGLFILVFEGMLGGWLIIGTLVNGG